MMKVFASDLDGTLFFRENEEDYCKEGDLKAIKKFQQEGHKFGCCSGRPFRFALRSLQEVLECDFYIVSSGGLILDKHYQIIEEYPIPYESIKRLCNQYKDTLQIYIHTLDYIYTYDEDHPLEMVKTIKDIKELENIKVYSLSLIDRDHKMIHEVDQYIKDHYPDVEGFVNIDAVDVALKGCSKGHAIKRVKEYYQAETSYGIGDSYNDIPMFIDSDYSFTFHRCKDEVKQYATYLVEDIKEALTKL